MGGSLAFDPSAFFLVFARVGGIVMLLPGFGEEGVPARVRLLLALFLSLAVQPYASGHLLVGDSGDAFAAQLVAEVLTGLVLGTLVKIVYSSAAMGGSVIAAQSGYAMAAAFDPTMGGQSNVVSRLTGLAAVLFIFAFEIHHLFIVGIVKSYAFVTPSMAGEIGDVASAAVEALSLAFALAMKMAAPFIVYGLLFNVGLGLVSRLTPTIQVFFVAQPLNFLIGNFLLFALLAAALEMWVTSLGEALRRVVG